MNEITIMENPRFGKVRKVMVNGEWYYVALDIAKALGYAKERNAIAAHCRCALKRGVPHPQNPNKEIEMTIIPKGDVLRLISESHLPAAEEFNHWLFDDVAVSVVDTGMYLTPERTQQLFADPASIIAICQNWQADKVRLAAANQKIASDKPKVQFAESFECADTNILIREFAKILCQHGYETGEQRLYATLRKEGYLVSLGADYNLPTQRSTAAGWFYVRVTPHPNSPNNVLRRTTMVTPKGQIYFLKHFCGKNYRLSKGKDLIQTTIEENLLPFEENLSCNDEDLF